MLYTVLTLLHMMQTLGGEVWPTATLETRSGESVLVSAGLEVVAGDIDTAQMLAVLEKSIVLNSAINRFKRHIHKLAEVRHTTMWQKPSITRVTVRVVGALDQAEELSRTTSYEYNVSVTMTEIRIQALSSFGIVYGLETSSQLLDKEDMSIPITRIVDRPAKQHRGLLVDVARHYMPLSLLKRTAASLGAAKMNVMHLHLTDSQSFPVLLSSVPELATKGSFDYPAQTYTPTDLRELVFYAKLFGVRIVPEIDIPAHTLSWGKAFPELVVHCSSVGINAASASDVPALDPSRIETFQTIRKVLAEIATIFPDELLHLGSDEVHFKCWLEDPRIRAWAFDAFAQSPEARRNTVTNLPQFGHFPNAHNRSSRRLLQAVLQSTKTHFPSLFRRNKPRRSGANKHRKNRRLQTTSRPISSATIARQILGHFLLQATNFATKELGKTVVIWQEALAAPSGALPRNTVVQTWHCWNNEDDRAANMALNAGFNVIDSACWYLDWPSRYLNYYTKKKLLGRWSELDGGEAALWTEHIDATNFDCKVWPRTAMVAQILWHGDIISGPNISEAKRLVTKFSTHLTDTTGMRPAKFDDDSGASGIENKAMCSSIDQVKSPRKPPTPPKRLAFAVCDEPSALLDPNPSLSQYHNDIYVVAAFLRFLDPRRFSSFIADAAQNGFPFVLNLRDKASAILSTAPIATLDNFTYSTGGLFLRLSPQQPAGRTKPAHILHAHPILRIHADDDVRPRGAAAQWADTSILRLPHCHLFAWHPDPNGAGEPSGKPPLSFFHVDDEVTTIPHRALKAKSKAQTSS